MFAVSLVAVMLAYPSPMRGKEVSPWVGKVVIMKATNTRFFRVNPDGSETDVGALTRTDYAVIREQGDRVLIKQDGTEGWILKSDAALPEEGIAHFGKLIEMNPNDSAQFARRSKAHELSGDLDAALKDYDEAIRISPASSSWWNNRANLFQKKKEYERALEDYNRSIELNANSSVVWGNRGNAYGYFRDYEKAIRDYTEAIRLNPQYTNSIANRGNVYRETADYDNALADYAAALRIDPQFAFGLAQRAELYRIRKLCDLAATDVAAAIRIDPRSATAFLVRGNLRRARKEYNLARDDYDHAIWLEPRLTLAYVERGRMHIELKQYDKALADYDAALKGEPKSIPALAAKADLLATCPEERLRNVAKAMELAYLALDRCRGPDGRVLAALAAALAENRDFDAAISQMEKALQVKGYAEQEGEAARLRLNTFKKKQPARE